MQSPKERDDKKRPKTQREPARGSGSGGAGRKTRIGYEGDEGFGKYKAGQKLTCRIEHAEPGGYSVTVVKDNLPGFLPTQDKLKLGQEILATFVCVHNKRALLAARSSAQKPAQSSAAGTATEAPFASRTSKSASTGQFRRATDLIPPPRNNQLIRAFRMEDDDLDTLIVDLEGGFYTGCVRASSKKRKSRSAALLYRGRVFGCMYGNENLPEPQLAEISLKMMISDLKEPDAEVLTYELPEAVILCMSALFLGYPVLRSDKLDARQYMDYVCDWLEKKQQTACLTFTLNSAVTLLLLFVHKGQPCGAFFVTDQKYSQDLRLVHDLLAKESAAECSAYILPQEMISGSTHFGFSLSLAKEALDDLY
jgi:hypothetical protein